MPDGDLDHNLHKTSVYQAPIPSEIQSFIQGANITSTKFSSQCIALAEQT